MLYKTFGNFFAALVFIFAALAIHQSAAAYGAFAGGTNSLNAYGLVVNTTISQVRANEEAIRRCQANGGDNSCRINGLNRTPVTNQCVAAYRNIHFDVIADLAPTRHEAEAKVANFCDLPSQPCFGAPLDLRSVAVCDSTCDVTLNQFIVDNPFDNAGCRRARNHTECAMVASITPYYDEEADNCTPVPAGVSLTPEFTIVVDGDAITTSEANPLSVAFADVSAIQITVATTVDGFTYTKTGNSSEELDVGMDDGVVGFNTTVSAGDYQIFVAAQNDIVAATISLYLTISPPVDDSPPNDDDDSDISLTLSPPNDGDDSDNSSPVVTVTPPTVTVTVTANECDGIVFVAADGGGCELNSVFCPAPNIVEGPLCVANTEQMNVVTITATVTVTVMVAVLSEGENVINYAGELVTVTTQAGTTDAFGVLESGVHLQVAADVITPINTNVGGGGGGSSGGSAAGIIGGVVVVGLALWYFASDSDDLTWTPSYAFRNNNGNISYSVGSRWTATTADNWNLYWQTRQNGDKFVYGSGFGYNGEILSAAMNSESESDKTDLDLNLSANKTVGLWNFGGGYRFDMELSDDATETQNRLNAQVRYTLDKWILSANANTDGKKGAARINYSYRF